METLVLANQPWLVVTQWKHCEAPAMTALLNKPGETDTCGGQSKSFGWKQQTSLDRNHWINIFQETEQSRVLLLLPVVTSHSCRRLLDLLRTYCTHGSVVYHHTTITGRLNAGSRAWFFSSLLVGNSLLPTTVVAGIWHLNPGPL